MSQKNDIDIKFDESSQEYYAIWEPIFIAMGKTIYEVLGDLRQTAHFGVDTFIDLELRDICTGKEG